jgi:nucleotide-binding universal stress UspA family protein
MKTILLPVDFSGATGPTVAAAISLARACAGEIILIHVVAPPEYLEYPLTEHDACGHAHTLARQNLQQLLTLIRGEGISASSKALGGFPVKTILAQARECKADVIVMGSHGHTAFYDLLVGSTSSGVLKAAPCPVMFAPLRKMSEPSKPALVAI